MAAESGVLEAYAAEVVRAIALLAVTGFAFLTADFVLGLVGI